MTLAQQLMVRMGVDENVVLLAHKVKAQGSFTKKGPGRKHFQGKHLEPEIKPDTEAE